MLSCITFSYTMLSCITFGYTTQGFLHITVSRQLVLFPFGLAESSPIPLHSTLNSVQPRQGVYSQ